MKRFLFLFAAAFLLPSFAFASAQIGKPAPAFKAVDIEGKAQSIAQYKGKIVVLEWNNPECPFVHKFYDGGAMQKFQADAIEKGVVWLTINSGAKGKQGYINARQAKEMLAARKSSPSAYILDPEGKIGQLYGAKTTPHMFVIDAKGNLAYAGAIDDKPGTDAGDIDSATNYVNAAIDALLAGKSVEKASTTAYGCGVKY